MIERIYNIKPKDILASIALEKAEGQLAPASAAKSKAGSPKRSPRQQSPGGSPTLPSLSIM